MTCRVVAVAGLALLLTSAAGWQSSPDIPKKKPPPSGDGAAVTGPDAFTISLEPEFALENGPVVYRITLTNRTAEHHECWRHTHFDPVRFTRTPSWVSKPTPAEWAMSISGQYGPYRAQVDAGKSASYFIAVQNAYQRIPPGRVSVEFEWDVVAPESGSWKSVRRPWGACFDDEEAGRRVPVHGRQTFEVLPATPESIARVKVKLEQYLREVSGKARPNTEIVDCLTGSLHPEFVPLMIRAVQLCEDCNCRQLIDTIYDSFLDPAAGFERLFPLLETGDPATLDLLHYWDFEAFEYLVHQRGVARMRAEDGNHFRATQNDLEVWNYSRVHANSRLTLGQHARILTLKNVWVRAAYWQVFPELCSPEWVLRLYVDLRRQLLPPDEELVRAVCRGLADDRFAVRERATADAMKMDERVVPALRDYLRQHPSAEFAHRVDLIAQHVRQQPVTPLAARVITMAMNGGKSQGELIFEALSGPAGSCRLADLVREKRPEQQKRRQGELKRQRELERLHPSK